MGDPQSETKSYLFVAKKVSLDLTNEEVQAKLSEQLQCQVKVYRAYRKNLVYFTLLES